MAGSGRKRGGELRKKKGGKSRAGEDGKDNEKMDTIIRVSLLLLRRIPSLTVSLYKIKGKKGKNSCDDSPDKLNALYRRKRNKMSFPDLPVVLLLQLSVSRCSTILLAADRDRGAVSSSVSHSRCCRDRAQRSENYRHGVST